MNLDLEMCSVCEKTDDKTSYWSFIWADPKVDEERFFYEICPDCKNTKNARDIVQANKGYYPLLP